MNETEFRMDSLLVPNATTVGAGAGAGGGVTTNGYIRDSIQLRFLQPDDKDAVRELCLDWFPIDYPDVWYDEITSRTSRFYSLAAVYQQTIVGLIVAHIKSYHAMNAEDRDILAVNVKRNPYVDVAYVLSLGVARPYRRHGIATMLLDALIAYVTEPQLKSVKAVFLHVLTTNTKAIQFYEKNRFQLHSYLPSYYKIKGESRDGYAYVLYLNDGRKPYSIFSPITKLYETVCAEHVKRSLRFFCWVWLAIWEHICGAITFLSSTSSSSSSSPPSSTSSSNRIFKSNGQTIGTNQFNYRTFPEQSQVSSTSPSPSSTYQNNNFA